MVSTLGQSLSQITLLTDLRRDFDDLNRRIASGKVAQTYAELEAEARPVLRFREEVNKLESYRATISITNSRLNIMSNSLEEASEQTRRLIQTINLQIQEGDVNIGILNSQAKDILDFQQDLINTEFNDRFVFAGTAVSTEPFESESTLLNSVQTVLDDWLNVHGDTQTLLNDLDALSDTDLGYAPRLGVAGDVFARADDNLEVDYTVKGDDDGFRTALLATAVIREISFPDDGNVASEESFFEVLNEFATRLNTAATDLDQAQFIVNDAASTLNFVDQRHRDEIATLTTEIADIENADTTNDVIRIQQLQIQLEASFTITGIASELRLINFI